MVSWNRILVPVVAAMGLFACNRPDPVSPRPDASTGSARVALPALPAGYLAGGSAALFSMDITGPDMNPIYVAETLFVGRSTTVEVTGIPPGQRVFHGVLYRIDSTGLDTMATHEGSAYAEIRTGATANVPLFLKSTGSGSAHVCLQVEGWPMDSSCVQPPPPHPYPNLAGCYALTVTKHGPREDTLFKAGLRLSQYDSSLFGVVTWKSGARDSAMGFVLNQYAGFILGTDSNSLMFQGRPDSATGRLIGFFNLPARGISGAAVAVPAPCDSIVPPDTTVPPDTIVPPPPKDSGRLDTVQCWNIKQQTVDGRAMKGSVWVGWRAMSTHAWFQWDGGDSFAMDNGTVPVVDQALYLFGKLPGGFAHPNRSAIETGHYKAKIGSGGSLTNGTAYARAGSTNYTSSDLFAEWSGSPAACPERAYAKVLSLFP